MSVAAKSVVHYCDPEFHSYSDWQPVLPCGMSAWHSAEKRKRYFEKHPNQAYEPLYDDLALTPETYVSDARLVTCLGCVVAAAGKKSRT